MLLKKQLGVGNSALAAFEQGEFDSSKAPVYSKTFFLDSLNIWEKFKLIYFVFYWFQRLTLSCYWFADKKHQSCHSRSIFLIKIPNKNPPLPG